MVSGALLLQDQMTGHGRKKTIGVLPIVFALSFLIVPTWGMMKMYGEGEQENAIALQLKQLNIHGSFTAITKPGAESQRMERLAYFSGNQLYSIPKQEISVKEVLPDMRRYHVKYLFTTDTSMLLDEQGKPFPELTRGRITGLKVFAVNP